MNRDLIKRFEVTRIRLDVYGYDIRGKYFGLGLPVYQVYDTRDHVWVNVRAKNAKAAREYAYSTPLLWNA